MYNKINHTDYNKYLDIIDTRQHSYSISRYKIINNDKILQIFDLESLTYYYFSNVNSNNYINNTAFSAGAKLSKSPVFKYYKHSSPTDYHKTNIYDFTINGFYILSLFHDIKLINYNIRFINLKGKHYVDDAKFTIAYKRIEYYDIIGLLIYINNFEIIKKFLIFNNSSEIGSYTYVAVREMYGNRYIYTYIGIIGLFMYYKLSKTVILDEYLPKLMTLQIAGEYVNDNNFSGLVGLIIYCNPDKQTFIDLYSQQINTAPDNLKKWLNN